MRNLLAHSRELYTQTVHRMLTAGSREPGTAAQMRWRNSSCFRTVKTL
jgi:hypothetical protein